MQQTPLSRMDRITITQMASAMREGFTTRDQLVPQFGKSTVERLGELASEEASKAPAH